MCCSVVCGESCSWAPPKGAQSCLDNGPNTLHKIGILRAASLRVLVLKGCDLFPQIGQTDLRREDGRASGCSFILGVRIDSEEMQAASIEALGHEWFVRSRLNLEINTRPSLRHRVTDSIDRTQERQCMRAPVRDVTWSLCLTAALRLKRDCLSEAV